MASAGGSAPIAIRAATPADVPVLLQLVGELAEYERLTHELKASEEQFSRALFGARPAAEALIAERGSETIGYALFFATFSTFRANQGVWLEDLFVRPSHRGAGVGRALLSVVAERTVERGGERLEWSALDWNDLALGFYERLGAHTMDTWVTHRLNGAALTRVAEESPARQAQPR